MTKQTKQKKQNTTKQNKKQSKQIWAQGVPLKKVDHVMENQIGKHLEWLFHHWALDPHPKVPVGSFDPNFQPGCTGGWCLKKIHRWSGWVMKDHWIIEKKRGKRWVDSKFVFFFRIEGKIIEMKLCDIQISLHYCLSKGPSWSKKPGHHCTERLFQYKGVNLPPNLRCLVPHRFQGGIGCEWQQNAIVDGWNSGW